MTRFSSESINNVELERNGSRVTLRWYAKSDYDAILFYEELMREMKQGFITLNIYTFPPHKSDDKVKYD